jgi:hypothetical protein
VLPAVDPVAQDLGPVIEEAAGHADPLPVIAPAAAGHFPVPPVQDPVSLAALRTDALVQAQVKERLRQLGLDKVPELDSDSAALSAKGKKPVSGRVAKIENTVSKQVLWPHSALDPKYVSPHPSYDNIDYPLLVAGEIAIILDSRTSKEEIQFRLRLLRELSYCVRVCRWQIARQYHSAFLTEVEREARDWSNQNFSELVTSVLAANAAGAQGPQHSVTQDSQGSIANPTRFNRARRRPQFDKDKVQHFFCKDFNQGSCTYNTDHKGELGGRQVLLEHICATCWLRHGEHVRHSEVKDCSRYKSRI